MSDDGFTITARILTQHSIGGATANAVVVSAILDLLIAKGVVSHDEVKEKVIDRVADIAKRAKADPEREDDNRNVPSQLMMLIQEVAANLNIDPANYVFESADENSNSQD